MNLLSKITQRYVILDKLYLKLALPIIVVVFLRFLFVVLYDLDYSNSYLLSYLFFPLLFDQIFLLLGYTFLKKNVFKIYRALFLVYLFISNSIFIHHIKVYGKPPGVGAIAALFETTPQEAFEFTKITPIGELIIIFILSAIVFVGIVRLDKNSKSRLSSKKLFFIIISLVIVQSVLILNDKTIPLFRHTSYVLQDGKNILYYAKEYIKLKKLRTNNKVKNFKTLQQPKLYSKKQVHVLVIGESLNRNHMKLYGYERNTTPNLDTISNINVFKNVVSPTTQTRSSIVRMMTESFGLNLQNEGSIINVLNEINYKTFWLSNQTRYGISDTETSIIADACDVVTYVNNDWKSNSLDEKLLPKLKIALLDTAKHKFIIVHLMGNHFEYSKRYVKNKGFELKDDYGFYKHNSKEEKERINEYDASVRYTDFIVSEIIRELQATSTISSLIFVSDHGEDVYENEHNLLGHGSPYVTKNTVEIPFILWQSNQFKEFRQLNLTSSELLQFYNNGNLMHSIADLLQVNFNGFEQSRSIFRLSETKQYPYIINSNNTKINYFSLE